MGHYTFPSNLINRLRYRDNLGLLRFGHVVDIPRMCSFDPTGIDIESSVVSLVVRDNVCRSSCQRRPKVIPILCFNGVDGPREIN